MIWKAHHSWVELGYSKLQTRPLRAAARFGRQFPCLEQRDDGIGLAGPDRVGVPSGWVSEMHSNGEVIERRLRRRDRTKLATVLFTPIEGTSLGLSWPLDARVHNRR